MRNANSTNGHSMYESVPIEVGIRRNSILILDLMVTSLITVLLVFVLLYDIFKISTVSLLCLH